MTWHIPHSGVRGSRIRGKVVLVLCGRVTPGPEVLVDRRRCCDTVVGTCRNKTNSEQPKCGKAADVPFREGAHNGLSRGV